MNTEHIRRRLSEAMDLIDTALKPQRVQCSTTYASGYINALQDARIITAGGAQYYREEVVERRQKRLALFGVDLQATPEDPLPDDGVAR